MSHDPLCPSVMDGFCFWCEVIAKVRADERARMLDELRGIIPADMFDGGAE